MSLLAPDWQFTIRSLEHDPVVRVCAWNVLPFVRSILSIEKMGKYHEVLQVWRDTRF